MVSKFTLCLGIFLLLCLAYHVNARHVIDGDDLEVAASGKSSSFKHGGGKKYHDEHKKSHGEKGKIKREFKRLSNLYA